MNQHSSRAFPGNFYIANTMEIFERLAWYGFFTLSSLYLTTPVAQGGVGFTESQRGALQGIIPFFLYLLPVFTGALADRYGYRKMFIASFVIMTPSYYLLGQTTSFSSFFLAFAAVALGAAIFKPVVVATISHATNDKNRGLGFGVFYTMVNVGGFIGPLVAGYARAISWDAVFLMSSAWIAINFIPAIFLYKDPPTLNKAERSFSDVIKQAQQVLGNSRFALLIFPCILALMVAGAGWFSYQTAFLSIAAWLVLNFIWDKANSQHHQEHWYRQKIKVSNKPFALYLAILTGFWAIYNQLFYTMPLFIRDFVDTRDLVAMLSVFGDGVVSFFAYVNDEALAEKIGSIAQQSMPAAQAVSELVHLKVMIPIEEVSRALVELGTNPTEASTTLLATQWADKYRQINPEYLINLDFAAIVVCQIVVSLICQKFREINVLVAGVLVFSVGTLASILAHDVAVGGGVIVMVILMMAFGEMITSPKSQEYVASIAPKEQSALYMGYYFVCMALGFLSAGLLSGWGYGTLAKEMNRPDLMWILFSLIGLATSAGLFWFNRKYIQNTESGTLQTEVV
ncbi:MFS transporter [Alteromonadaceae bacterium M269]|nr:MFS transporter [Alteromonadaceae bacterium M269]